MGNVFSDENDVVVKKDTDNNKQIIITSDNKNDTESSQGGFFSNMLDGKKTFRQLKKFDQGTVKGRLHSTIKVTMKATLGGAGDMREAVKLPPNEDLNEWLACNTVHFFNAASMVYGTCIEFCNDQNCPIMSAGPKFEYLWMDGKQYRKPTKVSAPQYIELLFNWIDEQLQDPAIFPLEDSIFSQYFTFYVDATFPPGFKKVVSNIFKRLFRLYGHIFFSHFDKCKDIGAEAHLNTCFKHFMFFVNEHKLVDEAELEPMRKLIDKFLSEK